jgi:hypothetical protein
MERGDWSKQCVNELSTDYELLVVGVDCRGKDGVSGCRGLYRRYSMRVTSVALRSYDGLGEIVDDIRDYTPRPTRA